MKKTFGILAPLFAVILFAGSAVKAQSGKAVSKGDAAAGNAENGKRVYVKYGCYTCHGFDGHGGVGPKLAPRPIASVAFIAIVRHPPPSGMPVFTAKIVSDTELNDMLAYLRSIPEPPALKDISILNP